MSRAVRHLFACLLLVLLPFQALAASFAVAGAPICAGQMMEDMDCCDQDSGACPDASHCAIHFAAIALPAQPGASPTLPGSDAAVLFIPILHESFIPDGLQRPPQASL